MSATRRLMLLGVFVVSINALALGLIMDDSPISDDTQWAIIGVVVLIFLGGVCIGTNIFKDK